MTSAQNSAEFVPGYARAIAALERVFGGNLSAEDRDAVTVVVLGAAHEAIRAALLADLSDQLADLPGGQHLAATLDRISAELRAATPSLENLL